MSDATAYMISSVLQDVSITGGKPANVAAKTGTTNYDEATMNKYNLPSDAIRDSWVIGYTSKTVIGMWYGYDFIDREYCLRNIPATVQKDKLFLALANSVFEKNKSEFKMPDSVVKAQIGDSYEYFKKGHEPKNATEEKTKLDTPTGLKVSNNGNRVTISWNKVNRLENDGDYGTFGYNVYQGNTLLAFTEDNSYTFTSSISPYQTYKVVATYKSFSGAQSDAATFQLKETAVQAAIKCEDLTSYKVGDSLPTGSKCYATINGERISTSISVKETDCGSGVFKNTKIGPKNYNKWKAVHEKVNC